MTITPPSISRAASASASGPRVEPEEERRVAARRAQPAGLQHRQQHVALGAVAAADLLDVRLVAPGGDRGALDHLQRRDADVRAVALERGDDLGVAGGEPGAVAGHRGALGERVEDEHVGAVGDLQRRRRRLVAEVQLGVGLVGGEHEVVLARQRGGALVELDRRGRGRRVVGVVEPQHADPRPGGGVDGVEVGQEAALGRQRQLEQLAPRERGAALVDGVGGRRGGDQLAAGDLGEVEDRLLGAERRDDLAVGVERDAEAAPRPAGDRRAQLGQAVGRGVGRERLDRGGERLADEGRRLLARLAHPEVDEVHAGRREAPLGLGEPHERVRAQAGERRGELHAANASSTR